MPFTDFLKATVFGSAAVASLLAVVCLAGFHQDGDLTPLLGLAGWWVACAAFGFWIGRRQPNPGIARLLAGARAQTTLPEVRPGRVLLNRLWPLLLLTVAASALAFAFPQVPGVFAGGAMVWALHWRRQESAVTAIEGRDGVRFFVEATKLSEPMQLVRTPGFKTSVAFEGAAPKAVGSRG